MSKLYEELDRNYKVFYEKLDMALNYLIDKYKSYYDTEKSLRLNMLNSMTIDLEKTSNLLDNYGYTYYPSNADDVSENNFEEIVMRYLDSFRDYLDGKSNIETVNVNIKTLLMIIDKHKVIREHFE